MPYLNVKMGIITPLSTETKVGAAVPPELALKGTAPSSDPGIGATIPSAELRPEPVLNVVNDPSPDALGKEVT